jgi:hypothetical protein
MKKVVDNTDIWEDFGPEDEKSKPIGNISCSFEIAPEVRVDLIVAHGEKPEWCVYSPDHTGHKFAASNKRDTKEEFIQDSYTGQPIDPVSALLLFLAAKEGVLYVSPAHGSKDDVNEDG